MLRLHFSILFLCFGLLNFVAVHGHARGTWPDERSDPRKQSDPDGAPIQRRIKILTDGTAQVPETAFITDSPDPSMILPIQYPNGVLHYRIYFTGMFYIEASDPASFYRGGIFSIRHSRGFYPDGTEMEILFDGTASPWDVTIHQNAKGEQIAFGGVMPQPEKGKLPDLRLNHTRSRWWGKVKHLKLPSGEYEEQIHWQAPLHDFNREPSETVWEGHGYGSVLLSKFDPRQGINVPVRKRNGNFVIYYERVSKQKEVDGQAIPYVTELFVRELNPDLTTAVGRESLSTSVISPVTKDFFIATRREGKDGGYLIEGASILFEKSRGQWIKTFSANEFTGRYGIYLDYLEANKDPKSKFRPVMNKQGELIDFATTLRLREILNATWVGRPVLEYAPDGKLWLRFHFVPIDRLPPGAPLEGHPPREFWGSYPRFIAQVPVKITYGRNGAPRLAWDLDKEFSCEKYLSGK